MEKIMVIEKEFVEEVNGELEKGWRIKTITPFSQPITPGAAGYSKTGQYGAYVVLTKDEKVD